MSKITKIYKIQVCSLSIGNLQDGHLKNWENLILHQQLFETKSNGLKIETNYIQKNYSGWCIFENDNKHFT